MGTIAVHEFTTLDNVIDAPTWTNDHPFDPKMGDAIAGIMSSCQAILLGRRTFEMFAPAWSRRSGEDDPGAPFMNGSPKYVVASRPPSVEWDHTTVIGPYEPATIQRLKDTVDGGIYVSGSGRLVRAMLADGLVDELHLFVYPLALGSGPHLFAEREAATRLELAGCESYDNGVVYLRYRPSSG